MSDEKTVDDLIRESQERRDKYDKIAEELGIKRHCKTCGPNRHDIPFWECGRCGEVLEGAVKLFDYVNSLWGIVWALAAASNLESEWCPICETSMVGDEGYQHHKPDCAYRMARELVGPKD